MRIDLPACSFKNCRHNFDHNCTKPNEYEFCNRGNIFTLTEKVYEKYPDDKDIWILLQEVTRIGMAAIKLEEIERKINQLYSELGL